MTDGQLLLSSCCPNDLQMFVNTPAGLPLPDLGPVLPLCPLLDNLWKGERKTTTHTIDKKGTYKGQDQEEIQHHIKKHLTLNHNECTKWV